VRTPCLLAAALFLGHQLPGAAAEPPAEQCLQTLFANGETRRLEEVVTLHQVCPGVMEQLAQAPWDTMLSSPPEDGEASVAQVMDLRGLLDDSVAPPLGPILDVAPVGRIVAETLRTPETQRGWWQRFLDWLDGFQREDQEQDMGWLVDWLRQVPDWAWSALWRATAAVILVLAVAIVANELRAAGPGPWRWIRRRRGAASLPPPGAGTDAPQDPAAVRRLPLQQQPAAMLALAIAALNRRGALPFDRSRTARELQAALPPRPPELGGHFDALRAASERTLYGGETLDRVQIGALYAELEPLLAATSGEGAER